MLLRESLWGMMWAALLILPPHVKVMLRRLCNDRLHSRVILLLLPQCHFKMGADGCRDGYIWHLLALELPRAHL